MEIFGDSASDYIADSFPFIISFSLFNWRFDDGYAIAGVDLNDGGIVIDVSYRFRGGSIDEVQEIDLSGWGNVAADILQLPILKMSVEIVAVGKDDKGGSIGDIVFPVAQAEHELVVEDYADAV